MTIPLLTLDGDQIATLVVCAVSVFCGSLLCASFIKFKELRSLESELIVMHTAASVTRIVISILTKNFLPVLISNTAACEFLGFVTCMTIISSYLFSSALSIDLYFIYWHQTVPSEER